MWVILYSKHRLLRDKKGYSLIEVILSIFLISIITLTAFSLLNFFTITSKKSNFEDAVLSNGRYAFEYIIDEIKRADRIVSSEKFSGLNDKYPKNLGFVIYNYEDKVYKDIPHGYTFYYVNEDNNSLYRIKLRRGHTNYPSSNTFANSGGINFLSDNVKDISNIEVNFQSNIIHLDFIFGTEEFSYDFSTIESIYCETDY